VSEPSRLERRLAVCEGHWALGERTEAVSALERANAEEPTHPSIAALSAQLLEELDPHDAEGIRERLILLCDAGAGESEESNPTLPPLSTSTLAELLAAQGHEEKALRVAEDVLRRNPNDARARAMRERLAPAPAPRAQKSARTESVRAVAGVRAADGVRAAPGARTADAVRAELERWLANLTSRRPRSPRSHGGAMR
jgi:hypothetical protein